MKRRVSALFSSGGSDNDKLLKLALNAASMVGFVVFGVSFLAFAVMVWIFGVW